MIEFLFLGFAAGVLTCAWIYPIVVPRPLDGRLRDSRGRFVRTRL